MTMRGHFRLSRRGLRASVASIVAITPFAVSIPTAFAGVGLGVTTTFPVNVTVGQTNVPASIQIANSSTSPESSGNVAVNTVNLVLACGTSAYVGNGNCPAASADPGVLVPQPTAAGHAGTACAGQSFSVAVVDTGTGQVTFTPTAGSITLTPPGTVNSTCQIDFAFSVQKGPVHGPSGPSGVTTSQVGFASGTSLVNSTIGSAVGTSNVKVAKAATSISTTATPSSSGNPIGDTAALAYPNPEPLSLSPAGSIMFTLFGPNDATCSGAPVFASTVPVNGTRSYFSNQYQPTAAGAHRWIAAYSGDVSNLPVTGACGDSGETSVVPQGTPGILTLPVSPAVTIGGTIADTANLYGGLTPTGTLTFTFFGPNNAACTGTPPFTSTVPVNGNTTYTSAAYTPPSPGGYNFVVVYSGDANNNPATSACGANNEYAVVFPARPTIVTNASAPAPDGRTVADRATLSGGFNPTGTITFKLYGPANPGCAGPAIFTSTVPVSGNNVYLSGTFPTTSPGTYNWVADYSGDANNTSTVSPCGAANETVVINPATSTISTHASASVAAGGTISDTATLTGVNPTGTITFSVFGPNDTTCATAPIFMSTAAVNAGNGTYPSTGFIAVLAGTYRFVAAYSGDPFNNVSTTSCNDANETVVVVPASPTVATQASTSVPTGGTISDTATISGGANPTGTIVFTVFGPANPSCTGSPVFTSSKPVSGNGAYASAAFTTTAAGTYLFRANYSGDANNAAVSAPCGASNESVVVTTPVTPALAVTNTPTPSSLPSPGGSITFTVKVSNPSATDPIKITSLVDDVYGDLATRAGSTCGTLIGTTAAPATAAPPCSFSGSFAGKGGDHQTDTVTVTGVDPQAVSVTATAMTTVTLTNTLKGYQPLVPVRICDTRPVQAAVAANQCNHNGSGPGTLGPAASLTVGVAGANGVPATATAVVLNVTATNTSADSFLTVWPAGVARPTASNLNWPAGQTVPNLVEVAMGATGVAVYNNAGSADVVVDLEGFVDSRAPGLFYPVAPARICDTRPTQPSVVANQCQGGGGSAGTLGPSATKIVTVGGLAGVPAGATAVVLNATVTATSGFGFLTVWPDGATRPTTSNLNWVPGQTVPNRVMVPLGPGGKLDVFNSVGSSDVIIDVNGYFSPVAGGSGYIPITPARSCDTRPVSAQVAANVCNNATHGGGHPLGPNDELTLDPSSAFTAVVLNVTAANTTADSYLTAFPDPTPGAFSPPPLISDLNWGPNQVIANLSVVGTGPAHAITFYNHSGTTDIIVDVEGVYSTTPTP